MLEQGTGTRGRACGIGQRQQKQLAGDELVTALESFFLRGLQQARQLGAHLHIALLLHARQIGHGLFGQVLELLHIAAGTLQQRARAVVLAQHGHQQVQGVDSGLIRTERQRLRIGQGFLEFGRQFVNSHGLSLSLQSDSLPFI